jgi:hypothetical protein
MRDLAQASRRGVHWRSAISARSWAGGVRALTERDLPEVVQLNQTLFPRNPYPPEAQAAVFREVCLRNPWDEEALRSLVYEDASGRVVGFLGVVPRALSFNGQIVKVAVSQHLMVAPASRSTLAAVNLLRAFLAGPQDLSMADWANEVSRRMWERLGGATSLPYSLHWRRPLRPASFALSVLRGRGLGSVCGNILDPACRLADSLLTRLPALPLRRPTSDAIVEPLDPETLLRCVERFTEKRALRPVYDRASLGWIVERLRNHPGLGRLLTGVVKDPKGEIAGWFLYYLDQAGKGQVFQIGATDDTIALVLSSLCHDAWCRGALEIGGRIEPRWMRAFSEQGCLFTPGLSWMLVHSRNAALLAAIDRGDAFLSRLEGDLWLL